MKNHFYKVGQRQVRCLVCAMMSMCSWFVTASALEIKDCWCQWDDSKKENPTFYIQATKSEYLLELSEYEDFSFPIETFVTVGNDGYGQVTLQGSDYKSASYNWRFRSCSYSSSIVRYPTANDIPVVTFGSKTEENSATAETTTYSDITLKSGANYQLTPVWLRSQSAGNYWVVGSPATWVVNNAGEEENSEWPVHGAVVKGEIVFTPNGGGKFNSAWITDGNGLGLYRMRLSDGALLPPLRITAPSDHPFKTSADGQYAAAMYYLGEDSDGTAYFTTTTDLVFCNPSAAVDIRLYAIDLSSAVAQSAEGGTLEARYVETLPFPSGTPKHSRHHYAVVTGSLSGAHTVWVTCSNTSGDAQNVAPITYLYRWTYARPGESPEVEKSTLTGLSIEGYTTKDYVTLISDRITPIDDSDMFYYSGTYFDSEGPVYYKTSPTLCRFVDGGSVEIISTAGAASNYAKGTMPSAVGVSFFTLGETQMVAYGSKNASGMSTVTIAEMDGDEYPSFSGARAVATLNPDGFSSRLRQSVEVKNVGDEQLLVSVGNGGLALYTLHNTNDVSTGVGTIGDGASESLTVTAVDGGIYVKSAGDFAVYNLGGTMVATGRGTGIVTVGGGLYIVVSGTATAKVLVR